MRASTGETHGQLLKHLRMLFIKFCGHLVVSPCFQEYSLGEIIAQQADACWTSSIVETIGEDQAGMAGEVCH